MHVIAEVGMAHEGSLTEAMSYIDMASDAGCWGVKFQYREPKHDPVQEFRPEVFHPQDEAREQYYQRVSFSPSEWYKLLNYRKMDIQTGCTLFAVPTDTLPAAIQEMDFLKAPRSYTEGLIACLAAFQDTLTIATSAVLVAGLDVDVVLGLDRWVGFDGISSHKPYIDPVLRAHDYGVKYAEVHVIKSRRYSYCPDAPFSLEFEELRELCERVA